MPTVYDVAAYVLQKQGQMTAMKLQKLVYYAQAWNLVWFSRPLFANRIEAWANGPVSPDLYSFHRSLFLVGPSPTMPGKPEELSEDDRKTTDAVLGFYGDKTPHWLSELTHREDPWKNARAGLEPGERSNREITPAAMAEYYESLV